MYGGHTFFTMSRGIGSDKFFTLMKIQMFGGSQILYVEGESHIFEFVKGYWGDKFCTCKGVTNFVCVVGVHIFVFVRGNEG